MFKISSLLRDLITKESIYRKDYQMCDSLFKERDLTSISEILESIIYKENRKKIGERINEYFDIINLKTELDEYLNLIF